MAEERRGPSVDQFRLQHIAYLQRLLQMTATDRNQQLDQERIAHYRTRQVLGTERTLRLEANMIINRQQLELASCRAALATAQASLQLEKRQLEDMAAELDRTQRKFHLVDSLVDTMLLQEDSQLNVSDRSRQITDLILDLDKRMEAKYHNLLQQRDMQIMELYHKIESSQ